VLEAVSEDRKSVNPNGVAFLSGPLAQIEAGGGDVLQLTCFLGSLDGAQNLRTRLEQKFPHAALDLIQPLRESAATPPVCEGVAAAGTGGNAGRLVFSSLQLAFGGQDADLRLAFERLGKTLEAKGASYAGVVHADLFALDRGLLEKGGAVERDFIRSNSSHLLVENLPSIDASAGIEAVVVLRR
jgi:hypothetical protein